MKVVGICVFDNHALQQLYLALLETPLLVIFTVPVVASEGKFEINMALSGGADTRGELNFSGTESEFAFASPIRAHAPKPASKSSYSRKAQKRSAG